MSLEAILTQIELQKLNVLAEFVGKGAQFKVCWDFFIVIDYLFLSMLYLITDESLKRSKKNWGSKLNWYRWMLTLVKLKVSLKT